MSSMILPCVGSKLREGSGLLTPELRGSHILGGRGGQMGGPLTAPVFHRIIQAVR